VHGASALISNVRPRWAKTLTVMSLIITPFPTQYKNVFPFGSGDSTNAVALCVGGNAANASSEKQNKT